MPTTKPTPQASDELQLAFTYLNAELYEHGRRFFFTHTKAMESNQCLI